MRGVKLRARFNPQLFHFPGLITVFPQGTWWSGLGLAVGTWRRDCCAYFGFVLGDAASENAMRLVQARSNEQSRSAPVFPGPASRGTLFSIAATVTVSDFDSVSPPALESRSKMNEVAHLQQPQGSRGLYLGLVLLDRPAP